MKPIALVCSDLHLTDKAPRMWGKVYWWNAQQEMLSQINQIASQHKVPILCGGDLFDKPRMPPAVELLAINHMAHWVTIPGQHDLPHHNMDLINESSYGVYRASQEPQDLTGLDVHFFYWGRELVPLCEAQAGEVSTGITIALVHTMVWQNEPPYPGAPVSGNVKNLCNVLHGYDFIVAGDNHMGFVTKVGDTTVVNCGSTMRRTVKQLDYKPMVHLLFDDKSVQSIELDISKDMVSSEHKYKKSEKDDRIEAFVDTLNTDVEISLSYQSNMGRYMEANNVEQPVRTVIYEEMK